MNKQKKPDQVADLTPAPYNPRKITPKQLDMLGKSMKEFGDLSGIVKNIRTGKLVGGHQRLKHFDPTWIITKEPREDETGTVAQGQIETPFGSWSYREVDWPEKREMAANIAANKHGGYFDVATLKDLILEIDDGSGTTLMAAEQIGRTAYLCELDPIYCDVIKLRWEQFTGKQGKLDES